MSNYYPNRDMLWSGFPTNWTLLKRLMWVRIMRGGIVGPAYETVTGNPVSFTTVRNAPLKQLKVAFSPVEDLHGYDSPWPAGGGKNKLNPTVESYTFPSNESNRPVIGTVNVEQGNTYVISYYQNTSMTSNTRNTLSVYYDNAEHYKYAGVNTNLAAMRYSWVYTAETTGEVQIKLWINAPDVSVYCDRFMVNDGGTLLDYAPYSNECPILGWDSLNVEQRGKNLANIEYKNQVPSINTGGMVNVAGWSTDFIYVNNAEEYYVSVSNSPTSYILFYDGGKGYLGYVSTDTYLLSSYSNWQNVHYVKLRSDNGSTRNPETQLELGSTATAYVPYNPSSRSISITLGQTVYSGTVDVVTGVVTVTHQSVDLGSLNWFVGGTITQDIKRMVTSDISRTIKRPETSGVLVDMMCEAYATINGNQVYSKITGIGSNSQGDISVYDPNYNTAESVADFTASVNGVKLVFPLATPIEIQLTPQEVSSLLGENNLFSDSNGDLTVEYRSN